MASNANTTAPTPPRAVRYLVSAKLRPPRVKDSLLERLDLVEKLRGGRDSALTLVCAPAGYGKTTLLAQWAAVDAGRTAFAWVSLDARDGDSARLWGHVIAALHRVHERVGERSRLAFEAGPRAAAETGLPLLLEELTDSPPVVLVLEDWHTVASRACDEMIAEFVNRVPAQVQVVVSTRHDPGMQIARLRAHGELTELRARDLSVSPAEAGTLFRAADIELSADDIRTLTERTEGWLAGLCLTLIALKEQEDPPRFVREFSADTRHVFDYLARDVMAAAEPRLRDFMTRSSVLDRLSAPLCDAVLERSDSASVLAEIARSNYFIVPLDASGSEYRYHHLFAAMLRRELAATDPAAVDGLHARATLWYEQHEDIERAIDHAISGRDVTWASALVTRVAVPFISAGRMTTLNRWLDTLSWPEARADRELALMRALSARVNGLGRNEVERWLQVAENGPDFGPLTFGVSSLHVAVEMISSMYLTRGIAAAERSARSALESEPAGSEWRFSCLVPLGQALYLAGRREEARLPLEEARTLPGARRRPTNAIALAYLSLIELAGGDVEHAERLARDALALAEEIGHAASPLAANAHLALGCVLMRSADLHAAVENLERAAELAGEDEPCYWHVHATLLLAAARHRLGDGAAAREALTLARAELGELPDVGMLEELYRTTEVALDHPTRHDGFLGEELSDAESRVLERLLEGRSVAEVARDLWLSPNTVKTHRRSIYRKLGATTRDEMAERASGTGLRAAETGR